jgi:hypothetical protein
MRPGFNSSYFRTKLLPLVCKSPRYRRSHMVWVRRHAATTTLKCLSSGPGPHRPRTPHLSTIHREAIRPDVRKFGVGPGRLGTNRRRRPDRLHARSVCRASLASTAMMWQFWASMPSGPCQLSVLSSLQGSHWVALRLVRMAAWSATPSIEKSESSFRSFLPITPSAPTSADASVASCSPDQALNSYRTAAMKAKINMIGILEVTIPASRPTMDDLPYRCEPVAPCQKSGILRHLRTQDPLMCRSRFGNGSKARPVVHILVLKGHSVPAWQSGGNN